MAESSIIQTGFETLKDEYKIYDPKHRHRKIKSIHNSWTMPFVSYLLYVNGDIERIFREAKRSFKKIKDDLKLDHCFADPEGFHRVKNQYEDLFYATLTSWHHLQLANKKQTSTSHFNEMNFFYLTRFSCIMAAFEEAMLRIPVRSAVNGDVSSLVEYTRADQARYYANQAIKPVYRTARVLYNFRKFLTRIAVVLAENKLKTTPETITWLPKSMVTTHLTLNFIALSISAGCSLLKDTKNLPKKPLKSALKLTIGFLCTGIFVGLAIGMPPVLIVPISLTLFILGRELGRGIAHLWAYRKTGHTHPEKYLLTELRIQKLESFDLNRLQIEDMRVHFATQMAFSKEQQRGFIGKNKMGLFKSVLHLTTDALFSHYRHNSGQRFWQHMMRLLQTTEDIDEIKALVNLYNKTKSDYLAEIKINETLQVYHSSYLTQLAPSEART